MRKIILIFLSFIYCINAVSQFYNSPIQVTITCPSPSLPLIQVKYGTNCPSPSSVQTCSFTPSSSSHLLRVQSGICNPSSDPCYGYSPIALVTATCTDSSTPTMTPTNYVAPTSSGTTPDEVSKFYNPNDVATIECSTTIESVTLKYGTNCPNQGNVQSCPKCYKSDGNQKCSIKIQSGVCSTTSDPCYGYSAIGKLIVKCSENAVPNLLGSTYVPPTAQGDKTSLFYNPNDVATIECSTTIESVTMKYGTNCPNQGNVQSCTKCATDSLGIQKCSMKIQSGLCSTSSDPCNGFPLIGKLIVTCSEGALPVLTGSTYVPPIAPPTINTASEQSIFYSPNDLATIECTTTIESVTMNYGTNCPNEANVQNCPKCATDSLDIQKCKMRIQSGLCSTSSDPCYGFPATAKITAKCSGSGIPIFSGSTYNSYITAPLSKVFYPNEVVTIICLTSIQSVVANYGTNCPNEANVQTCNKCAITQGTQFCKMKIQSGLCSTTSDPCSGYAANARIIATCSGGVSPIFISSGGSAPTPNGDPVSKYFNPNDNAKIYCPTKIASVNVRYGTNCPNEANVQSCPKCAIGQDTTTCSMKIQSGLCSTTSDPCYGYSAIARITATCTDYATPVFTGSTYVSPSYPTAPVIYEKDYVSGQTATIECSTTIQSVTVNYGTNCPNPTSIQTCPKCNTGTGDEIQRCSMRIQSGLCSTTSDPCYGTAANAKITVVCSGGVHPNFL